MITFKELLKRAKNEAISIHTLTKKQAKTLLIKLDKKEYKWASGKKLTSMTYYEVYKENTCYSVESFIRPDCNIVVFNSLDDAKKYDYAIIEFTDINFKEE